MRCPYCGGLNSDRASFCAYCGRDISVKPPFAQPVRQPQPTRPANQPPQPPPAQPPLPAPAPPTGKPGRPYMPPTVPQQAPGAQTYQSQSSLSSGVAKAPEPPAPFPPRTLEQLKQLEQGALSYTVVKDTVESGKKKTIRISYPCCVTWQQVATLWKAFKEQQTDTFNTIIIQGFQGQDADAYRFTNGQLQFDRAVRLGSQTLNRYQIESGSGFENDAVRIVLSE